MSKEIMNISSYTDEQLLNLVNNSILTKTEFKPSDFTGGSVQATSTHSNKVTNIKVSLFFGYTSKKPITRTIDISKGTYYIWGKAIMLKVASLEVDTLGIDFNELNGLMNSPKEVVSRVVDSIEVVSSVPSTTPTTTPTTSKTLEAAVRIANYLHTKILSVNESFSKVNIDSWANDIDKAIRLDNRTEEQLVACIDWIYKDSKGSFWIPNIMSGKKLREKFDTMNMQVIATPKTNKDKLNDIYATGLTATEIISRMENY